MKKQPQVNFTAEQLEQLTEQARTITKAARVICYPLNRVDLFEAALAFLMANPPQTKEVALLFTEAAVVARSAVEFNSEGTLHLGDFSDTTLAGLAFKNALNHLARNYELTNIAPF